MADAILIQGGSGGIDSSDVTANKADVLEGKSTITSDSDDEVVQGTMPLLLTNSDLPNVMMCFDRGSWDFWGKGGAIDSPGQGRGIIVSMRPEDGKKYALDINSVFVFMPIPDLKAENIRADKNIAKIQGSIPVIGKVGVAPGNGWFNHEFMFILNIPQGIYEAQGESWAPELRVPIGKVREILGILAHKIAADENIAGVQGTLPVWDAAVSGYSDVMYAWADQGHYLDHPIKGRGVILRIPNNHVTRGGNWVYLAEPDLIGSNIRQGVNMFGVQGEMVDYGTGRAAFYNATFDGALLSGVAHADRGIRFGQVYAQGNISFGNGRFFVNYSEKFKYLGIRDGGLKFSIAAQGDSNISYEPISAFFAHSVNLAPFRKIKVGGVILNGSYQKRTIKNDLSQIQFGLVAVSKKNVSKRVYPDQYNYAVDLNNNYKGVHVSFVDGAQDDKGREHSRLAGQQLWAEVDVSDINEQCFMFVYAGGTSFVQMSAEVVINHIEFIN